MKNSTKKTVYYVQADKGNAVVIMDKQQVTKTLKEDKIFEVIKNPLLQSIKRVRKVLNLGPQSAKSYPAQNEMLPKKYTKKTMNLRKS